MKTEGKYEYSKDYRTTLDKALEALVEIDLLDLIDDSLERGIEDFDKGDPDTDREVAVILYNLLRGYVNYRGYIENYLDDLGYNLYIKAIPLENPYTRGVSIVSDKDIDKAIDLFLEVRLKRGDRDKIGLSRAEIDKVYPYTSLKTRGYLSIVLSSYEGYSGNIDEYLDLIRYTYTIDVYGNPIRSE